MLVLLDPGHGRGCVNASPDRSLVEWEFTRHIASLLMEQLLSRGIDCALLVDGQIDVPLADRVRTANAICRTMSPAKVAIISLHADAIGGGRHWCTAHGASVRIAPNASQRSRLLATWLAQGMSSAGIYVRKPSPDVPYWTQSLAICRDTIAPAVLIECGFMTNHDDCEKLLRPDYQARLVETLAEGIKDYCLYQQSNK